jgi:hypothetical protein
MTNHEFSHFLIKLIHDDSTAPVMNLAQLQRANVGITLNSLDNCNECTHSKNVALIEQQQIYSETQASAFTQQKWICFGSRGISPGFLSSNAE